MLKDFYSVSEINNYVKELLDSSILLSRITLKGEISNFKEKSIHTHLFFTLKDEKSSISVVMFANDAAKLNFIPKDGDEVLVYGRISSYPARGQYQLYISDMNLFGQGEALLKLEMLKKKLASEGLFDESRKRKINRFPLRIGIITAKNSAACADMIKNISRRYPLCQIYLFYSLVQGKDAPKDLLRAFKKSQEYSLDTLIIGRGGGANEDLSAFNDEELVRAVSISKMPVISAVGHEIDMTLLDYVSDVRASTPTGAAEFATMDVKDILMNIASSSQILDQTINRKIADLQEEVAYFKKNQFFANPSNMYKDSLIRLTDLKRRLIMSSTNYVLSYKQTVDSFYKRLNSLNPSSVLSRGYAILSDNNNNLISSLKDVMINEEIKVSLKDGIITSIVKNKKRLNKDGK